MGSKWFNAILLVLILVILLVLQGSFFKLFPFLPVGPNLLIVATAGIGFIRGRKAGLITGLLAGLMLDLQYATNFGLYGLVYMHIGYFAGSLKSVFARDNLLILMSTVAASDFIYNVIIYVFSFLFRQRFGFLNYLFYTIVPEIILTVIIMLLTYKPLLYYSLKLDEASSKGRDYRV